MDGQRFVIFVLFLHVAHFDDRFASWHGYITSAAVQHAEKILSTFEKTSKKSGQASKNSAKSKGDQAEADAGKSGENANRPKASDTVNNAQDWIAEVSHELRLPIANIRLLVETLLDGALDDPATARRMLNRTKVEIDRLQSLVVNLLSVETVSQSREVYCELVSLESRARSAIDTVSKLANEKSIHVELKVTDGFQIYANPAQLDQVLLNLLENAIKFTPNGGTVFISSGEEPGTFEVRDTGIGMPEAEIPKIFQRFYRIDRAQSRGSTGLGLSIVKHIIDLHGAKIKVASKEGVGSSFSLTFPGPRGSNTERYSSR